MQFDKSYENVKIQDESSQVGSKKVTSLSSKKYRRQLNKPSDNKNSWKLKHNSSPGYRFFLYVVIQRQLIMI